MITLDTHLSASLDWLSATHPDNGSWEFGPGPPLTNFPDWVSDFAGFDDRTLMRAILAASYASSPAWDDGQTMPSIQNGESYVDRLPYIRRWINRDADEHPAWLSELADQTLAMHWCDAELFHDQWFSQPNSAAHWALDSALHCLLTLHAITRDYGRRQRTYASMSVIAATNGLRCHDLDWVPAVSRVVDAIRSEFRA